MLGHIINGRGPTAQKVRSTANTVRNADLRIVDVLAGLAASFKKTSCWPSQKKIIELIRSFTGRTLSRATLNRHLNRLESDGYVRRIRRHRRNRVTGRPEFHSTCYVLMMRACDRLKKQARSIARLLAASVPSHRVSLMSQYLTSSLKELIQSSA